MTTLPTPTPPENPNGPEWLPVPLSHPWCPPDRRFPSSYWAAHQEDPRLCVAEDPCSADGETTLWMIQPCQATVAVGEPPIPPSLPATGLGGVAVVVAVAAVGIGAILWGVTRRRKGPE